MVSNYTPIGCLIYLISIVCPFNSLLLVPIGVVVSSYLINTNGIRYFKWAALRVGCKTIQSEGSIQFQKAITYDWQLQSGSVGQEHFNQYLHFINIKSAKPTKWNISEAYEPTMFNRLVDICCWTLAIVGIIGQVWIFIIWIRLNIDLSRLTKRDLE